MLWVKWKHAISVNSHYVSSVFTMLQLVLPMCFHLQFAHLPFLQKPPQGNIKAFCQLDDLFSFMTHFKHFKHFIGLIPWLMKRHAIRIKAFGKTHKDLTVTSSALCCKMPRWTSPFLLSTAGMSSVWEVCVLECVCVCERERDRESTSCTSTH